MFCSKCGREVKDTENFCPNCGAKIMDPDKETAKTTNDGYRAIYSAAGAVENPSDVPTTALMVVSFLIPVVGLILYCIWSHDFPKKAKCCLKGFIGSIIFCAVIFCCFLSIGINQMKETHYYYDDDFFSHVVEVIE